MVKCILLIVFCSFPCIAFANDLCADYGRKSEGAQSYIDQGKNSFEVASPGRLYFYDSPNKACKISNLFLVPGDIITGYTEYNGFVSVAYAKTESWSITGWLDKSQLKNLKAEKDQPRMSHCELVSKLAASQVYSGGTNIPDNAFSIANKSKVVFYKAPDKSCPEQDTFIIKDENVYSLKKYADFVLVQYITKSGGKVLGWVLQTNLNRFIPSNEHRNDRHIGIVDFIAVNGNKWIGVGSSYNRSVSNVDGVELGSSYIGDFPNEVGGLYKFIVHEYKNINVNSSNVNYDERQCDIDDDYVVSAINIKNRAFSTARGIKIGDSVDEVLKVYPANLAQITPEKISYSLNDKYLDFTVKDQKIVSINMGIAILGEE